MAKAICDVCVKSGSYQDRDGNTKSRFEKVGTIFEAENGNKSLLLTMVPLCNFGERGGVWLSIFPIDGGPQQQQQGQRKGPQQPARQPQNNATWPFPEHNLEGW